MPGTTSPYAALELEPGASRAAVEQAYRRLIKLHHPDRSGGDAQRAADINRAYFELRRHYGGDLPDPPAASKPVRRRHRSRRRSRARGRLWLILALAVLAMVLAEGGPMLRQVKPWIERIAEAGAQPLGVGPGRAAAADAASLDGPLGEGIIAGSVNAAVRLAGEGDAQAIVGWSRDCHLRLRARPSLAQLDRCAAFDDAVAAIADLDPAEDGGPFNASSITARQMSAAKLLSNDYLSIERRLDRIRTRVELALAPAAPPPT